MRRIISALLFCLTAAAAHAQDAKPVEIAPGAPDRHTVVPGDTLWGIAAKFLKDPYRWPQVWRLNAEQVKNPQRIYPGQVVRLLDTTDGPVLALETVQVQRKIYVEELAKPIPTIDPQAIEPFLSEPRIVDATGLDNAPRVVGIVDNRVIAGAGDSVYVTGVKDKTRTWQIFRPGQPLKDPETKQVIGYEAFFLGTARQSRDGNPATFQIISSRQEIGVNDRLQPAPRPDVPTYLPRPPAKAISGRIVSVYGAVNTGGANSVVTINRGKADGLEPGHTLAVFRAGDVIDDRTGKEKQTFRMPDEKNGLIFIFRVFDKVSYALVMSAARAVLVGDPVQTP